MFFSRIAQPTRIARTCRAGALLHTPTPGPRPRTRLFPQFRAPQQPLFQTRSFYDERLRTARPLLTPGQLGRVARSPRTKYFFAACAAGAVVFYVTNLETVPVSGRTRFNCYGDGVSKLNDQHVKRVLYEIEAAGQRVLPRGDYRTEMVYKIMSRLISVSGLEKYDWEIRVIDAPHIANAFILPGGKVFVYTGIFSVSRNLDGLAAVLSHEVAHGLAQHHGERQSVQIGPNILLYGLIFLTAPLPGAFFAMQMLGGWLVDLLFGQPMSRKMESEADYIGLMLMAEACYDPREAAAFWGRMEAREAWASAADQVPEWMSTHPSHQRRMQQITEWMPQAMEKRRNSDCSSTSGFASLFRDALLRPGSIYVI